MERGMRWKLHVPCGVGEKLAITSKIYLSQLFKEAVKYPTARIIIGHNHPSGDPEPSQADLIFTKRMIECGNLMGIELLDHIIIGQDNYLSLREVTNIFD